MGRPAPLTRRWILVVKPPLEQPRPCLLRHGLEPVAPHGSAPFCARCLMMGADHCAVDYLKCIRHDPAFAQDLQDLLPRTRQGPASELAVDTGPLPELCRQVTPRRACPGYPENPIKNEPMVGRFAPVRRSDGQNEALVKSPLFVQHQISCQAGLHHRYQLESRSARPVSPFRQHGVIYIKMKAWLQSQ